jgi:hypothetical protein
MIARDWLSKRLILIGVGITLPFALFCAGLTIAGSRALDWEIYATAAERAWAGAPLYEWHGDYAYVYSPPFAYLFAGISWIGPDAWRLAHVLAALLMPNWPMRVITVVSWPFWFEMQYGNLVVFILLAGAWSVRGSRGASLAFLALAVLMPRPLMVPVAGWVLWEQRRLRVPFAAMVGATVMFSLFTGHLGPWVTSLIDTPDVANASDVNFGPSRIMGQWWLLIGFPVGAWLTFSGRLGWASLAVSPYLLPQYFLMVYLEFLERRHRALALGSHVRRACAVIARIRGPVSNEDAFER